MSFRSKLRLCFCIGVCIIEIDNDERGVIGDFTTISDIRITKAKAYNPELGVVYFYSNMTF